MRRLLQRITVDFWNIGYALKGGPWDCLSPKGLGWFKHRGPVLSLTKSWNGAFRSGPPLESPLRKFLKSLSDRDLALCIEKLQEKVMAKKVLALRYSFWRRNKL